MKTRPAKGSEESRPHAPCQWLWALFFFLFIALVSSGPLLAGGLSQTGGSAHPPDRFFHATFCHGAVVVCLDAVGVSSGGPAARLPVGAPGVLRVGWMGLGMGSFV